MIEDSKFYTHTHIYIYIHAQTHTHTHIYPSLFLIQKMWETFLNTLYASVDKAMESWTRPPKEKSREMTAKVLGVTCTDEVP